MVDRHKNYHQYLRNSLVILFSINISRFTTHAQLKNKLPFIGIFYCKLDSVTSLGAKKLEKKRKVYNLFGPSLVLQQGSEKVYLTSRCIIYRSKLGRIKIYFETV